jgi:hypothetical protein
MDQSLKSPSWPVIPEKAQEAVRGIVEAGRPVKVLLLGSYGRGVGHPDRCLGILVVAQDRVKSARRECPAAANLKKLEGVQP